MEGWTRVLLLTVMFIAPFLIPYLMFLAGIISKENLTNYLDVINSGGMSVAIKKNKKR